MGLSSESKKCPSCGSFQIEAHYKLHVGYNFRSETIPWTTRKFREQNNLKPDSGQILIVPPIDLTWNTCRMCGTEFDEEGKGLH